MGTGSRKLATVVLSASCLTAGLLVAPASGVVEPISARDLAALAAPREKVPAPRVRPGRIKVRVTMNGDLVGAKPRITLIGVEGRAMGVIINVTVRSVSVVKGLQRGRYRVSAQKLTADGRAITPNVAPAQVRLSRSRGATVLVRYRMAGVPDDYQGDEHAPIAVAGGHTFMTLTAGGGHTCGVDTTGKAWCWGNDQKGGLGDGKDDQASEYSPVAVAGDHTFTTLTAGGMHTCGVDTTGKAWCWGSDGNGKLGDGDDGQAREYSPVAVAGGHTFTTLTASNMHTCGVDTAGKAWCWGWDTNGAAGDGADDQGNKSSPVAVDGGHTFTTLTAGDLHTCGVETTGKAWCWGWDGHGQVGDGDDGQGDEHSPVAVAGGHTFTSLSAGYYYTCGVATDGVAWCWGADSDGILGDGDADPAIEYSPVPVAGGHTFTTLTASNHHTCGVETAGAAWCWGADSNGILGDGKEGQGNWLSPYEYSPVPVAGGHTFATLTAGGMHTCGVETAGAAWCWGWDGFGQVGDGDEYR